MITGFDSKSYLKVLSVVKMSMNLLFYSHSTLEKMKSKCIPFGLMIPYISLLLMFGSPAISDMDNDKEKCADNLVGLATCLPYVSGDSNALPIDCCVGLKQVLQNSPQCLCLLVKDRNDPTLGLQINATRALNLPSKCNAPPASISNCPALLHLPPNSPDAKVFEDFAKSAAKENNATAPAPAIDPSSGRMASGDERSGGTIRKSTWSRGLETVAGILLSVVVSYIS